ncbi:two-component sensor histidine kinase, partial [Streptomyces albidoflavus]
MAAVAERARASVVILRRGIGTSWGRGIGQGYPTSVAAGPRPAHRPTGPDHPRPGSGRGYDSGRVRPLPKEAVRAGRARHNGRMVTTCSEAAPRHEGLRQSWRLLAAGALGIPFWLLTAGQLPPGHVTDGGYWFVVGDPLVALGCLVALVWRRRFPLPVTLVVVLASAASA